jgi:hypothetical protein
MSVALTGPPMGSAHDCGSNLDPRARIAGESMLRYYSSQYPWYLSPCCIIQVSPGQMCLSRASVGHATVQRASAHSHNRISCAQVKVHRLDHYTPLLGYWARGDSARRKSTVKLLQLHDPLTDIGSKLTIPHALAPSTTPQQLNGLASNAGFSTFRGHHK